MKRQLPRRVAAFTAAVLPLFALAGAGFADDAQQVFNALFAEKLKAVNATGDRADDVALGKEMLTLAQTQANEVGFLALLCDSAYDLGMRHSDGFATAIEAMTLLAEKSPAHRDAADAKRLDALNRAYVTAKADDRAAAGEALIDAVLATADASAEKQQFKDAAAAYRRALIVASRINSPRAEAIRDKVAWAVARDRIERQITQYRTKLLEDANDHATAEALVKLYIVELNSPADVKPYLRFVKDETLKTNAALAAEPIGSLDEKACETLGVWYHELAKANRKEVAADLYEKAASYYRRFLELHPTNDLARTKVAAFIKEIDNALAATSPAESKPTSRNSAFIPAERLAEVFNLAPGLRVEDDVLTGRVGNVDYAQQTKLRSEVEGRAFRFGFKMKAKWYHYIDATVNGESFEFSRGHWFNDGTAVKGNSKNAVRLKEIVDAPGEWASLEMQYDGREVKYFYNGKLAYADKVTRPTGPGAKIIVGFRSHETTIQVKDVFLIVDGKPQFVDGGK